MNNINIVKMPPLLLCEVREGSVIGNLYVKRCAGGGVRQSYGMRERSAINDKQIKHILLLLNRENV